MGPLSELRGNRAYLDTNIFVYAIERVIPYAPLLGELLAAIDHGDLTAVTSELTLAEVLVKPLREGNRGLASDYECAIQSRPFLDVVSVRREILREAARLRTATPLKLPDAIHAATAALSSCTHFVTNDTRFECLGGMRTLVLQIELDRASSARSMSSRGSLGGYPVSIVLESSP